MMKFFTFTSTLALLIASVVADQVTYDQTYDNGANSLNTVACLNGANGLVTKGFTTFSSLPSFPFIGGAAAVPGWNSPNCGTCWSLTFNGTTINVLAIDHAASGFNIGLNAMNKLTNGSAVQVGVVNAAASQVAASVCGL